MEITPQTIGTAVLLIIFILDKAVSLLKTRGIDLHKMGVQLNELHKWHDVADDEGVKIWYVRRSLEDAIAKLATNIELETRVLEKMDRRMERIESKLDNKK